MILLEMWSSLASMLFDKHRNEFGVTFRLPNSSRHESTHWTDETESPWNCNENNSTTQSLIHPLIILLISSLTHPLIHLLIHSLPQYPTQFLTHLSSNPQYFLISPTGNFIPAYPAINRSLQGRKCAKSNEKGKAENAYCELRTSFDPINFVKFCRWKWWGGS